MPKYTLPLAMLAIGCSDKGDDSNGGDDSGQVVTDVDKDGFSPPEDCDDDDPSIHPEADETCDEVDDDCDGTVDDDPVDAIAYFTDSDADGYGAGKSVLSCEPVAGSVENADDCDDANPSIHPGAVEVCDEADTDEDCDSLVDDEDDSFDVSTGTTVYADADGDGYGDAASEISVCDELPGYVATADDCNDASAAVNPAAEEVCGDGLDNNCDSTAEGCELSGEIYEADAHAQLTGAPLRYGAFGHELTGLDSNGDGVGDLAIGSYGNYAALFTGPIETTSVEAGGETALITGAAANDEFGDALSEIGDQDGDGFDDLLVAAQWYPDGAANGRSYVLLGPISGTDSVESMASATITGNADDQLGFAPSSGDVDGDGVPDVLLGARYMYEYRGAAFLFYGPITSGDLGELDAGATWTGNEVGDGVGIELAANGDLDGDGVDEVVLGAPGWDDPYENGAAWIYYGPVTGDYAIDEADVQVSGADDESYLGPIAIGGDLDADGRDDLAVGGPHLDAASDGNVWVFSGSSIPSTGTLDVVKADAKITGEFHDQFGTVLESSGDLDDDGHDDLVVATYYAGGYNGAAWGYYGPVTGTLAATEDSSFKVHGKGEDGLGNAIALVPDVGGDGIDDLAVAASWWIAPDAYGAVFVFFGGSL
jgi:hypothetical protein